MRRVSVISPSSVDAETKVLHGNGVALTEDVDTLDDLAEIGLAFDIAPAVFHDNRRLKAALDHTDWLIYDFDDGTPSERVHQALSGENYRGWRLNHLMLGSRNHLKDKGDGRGRIERFHVFVPLRQPIRTPEFYTFTVCEFARLFAPGLKPDPACKDVTRYLARHSAKLWQEANGIDLPLTMFEDLWALRASTPKAAPRTKPPCSPVAFTPAGSATDPLSAFLRTKAHRILREEMSHDGERYAKSMTIIGVMKRCGLSLQETLELFDRHTKYGTSFTRESVERMFRQFT